MRREVCPRVAGAAVVAVAGSGGLLFVMVTNSCFPQRYGLSVRDSKLRLILYSLLFTNTKIIYGLIHMAMGLAINYFYY